MMKLARNKNCQHVASPVVCRKPITDEKVRNSYRSPYAMKCILIELIKQHRERKYLHFCDLVEKYPM